MSKSRVLSPQGFLPAAMVLLLTTAMVAGGLEIRPAPAGGCSIATEDHEPEPQPREESAEEEEGESAKHAALGSVIVLERPATLGGKLPDCHARLAPGARLEAAPIRGPPPGA